jgi:hypothetical protein
MVQISITVRESKNRGGDDRDVVQSDRQRSTNYRRRPSVQFF